MRNTFYTIYLNVQFVMPLGEVERRTMWISVWHRWIFIIIIVGIIFMIKIIIVKIIIVKTIYHWNHHHNISLSDMFGRNDFLGEVMLPMSGQLFDDPSSQWFSLQDRVRGYFCI